MKSLLGKNLSEIEDKDQQIINCLNIFEKEYRCNHCNIIIYDSTEYKKAEDGFTYCNDEDELTVGNKPCYQILFEKK